MREITRGLESEVFVPLWPVALSLSLERGRRKGWNRDI